MNNCQTFFTALAPTGAVVISTCLSSCFANRQKIQRARNSFKQSEESICLLLQLTDIIKKQKEFLLYK